MEVKKSISELVADLEAENESLGFLGDLAEMFCLQEFGHGSVELHDIVMRYDAMEKCKQDAAND